MLRKAAGTIPTSSRFLIKHTHGEVIICFDLLKPCAYGDNLLNDSIALKEEATRLGQEIRKLRKARGRSLEDVAKSIGRSVSFCSQLERGQASASIVDLKGIAGLFNVNLGWFFFHDQVPHEERGRIVRGTTRRRIETISDVQEELLSPDIGGGFEMFLTMISPRAASPEFNMRDTEEEGYVVSGTLELWISDAHFILNAGDSFRIAREQYKWKNPTDDEVMIVWVIAP